MRTKAPKTGRATGGRHHRNDEQHQRRTTVHHELSPHPLQNKRLPNMCTVCATALEQHHVATAVLCVHRGSGSTVALTQCALPMQHACSAGVWRHMHACMMRRTHRHRCVHESAAQALALPGWSRGGCCTGKCACCLAAAMNPADHRREARRRAVPLDAVLHDKQAAGCTGRLRGDILAVAASTRRGDMVHGSAGSHRIFLFTMRSTPMEGVDGSGLRESERTPSTPQARLDQRGRDSCRRCLQQLGSGRHPPTVAAACLPPARSTCITTRSLKLICAAATGQLGAACVRASPGAAPCHLRYKTTRTRWGEH